MTNEQSRETTFNEIVDNALSNPRSRVVYGVIVEALARVHEEGPINGPTTVYPLLAIVASVAATQQDPDGFMQACHEMLDGHFGTFTQDAQAPETKR